MKCAIHRLALASVVVFCALAGSAETALQRDLFGASFEDYARGDPLSDVGARNGTWGKVPEGTAVAEEDTVFRKKYMALFADNGLVFTPYSISEKKTCSDLVSIRVAAYEEWSALPVPTGARAAFAIFAPEAGGETNYLGWVGSRNCWTNLYPASNKSSFALDKWQEVMVRFLKLNDSHDGYVQYWLKRSDDSGYVPLHTVDDVYWIRTGGNRDSRNLGKIGFVGEGGLERISGQEPNRGLIVGVGSWYDYQYAESIYAGKRIGENARWETENDPRRIRSDELRSYIIEDEDDSRSVTYLPSMAHSKENVEVTELEVQFTSGNDDESIPEDACARIRMVEDEEGVYRFACLVGGKDPEHKGQWMTNTNWAVDVDAKYTIEISLLRMSDDQKFVSYRYKEGYGLEGGAYRDLFLNEPMLSGSSGKTIKIDFDGYGVVHAVRGKNKPK